MISPKVSIIIPVYNGSNYLREAIDSALAQSYEDVEVIVVNDGSTDAGATEAIAKSYGDRIRYFAKENGGVSTALNLGIEKMKGDYFAWLSHDDVYLPQKISRQISFIKELNKKNAIIYSDLEIIDQDSKRIGIKRVQSIEPSELRFRLMDQIPVNGCAVLIPRSCFSEVGLFNTELRVVQDVDMFLRLSRKFEFLHIPEILIQSRYHPDQGTENLSPAQYNESITYLNRYFEEIYHEAPNGDAIQYLIKSSLTLHNSRFHDSAIFAYSLVRKKINENPIFFLRNFPYISIYWITQQPLWRILRIFTVVPYRKYKKFLSSKSQ